MAAYSALCTLALTLDDIRNHTISVDPAKLRSLRDLVQVLKHSLQVGLSDPENLVETKIRDVASAAADFITTLMFQDPEKMDLEDPEKMDLDVDSWILQLQGIQTSPSDSDEQETTVGENVVFGLDRHVSEIIERLVYGPPVLEFVPIVGMGGIGKTTLATQVYKDGHISRRFDICAWATVTREDRRLQVLLDLLDSAKFSMENMQRDRDHEKLGKHLYRSLIGRRYLIVIDDVWDEDILYGVGKFLPNDENGSRVLFTTRLRDVARIHRLCGTIHEMNFLEEQESQCLLHNRVFGKEECPVDLRGIQNEILQKCNGLPLALVVIGNLLSKIERTVESWRGFLQDLEFNIIDDVNRACMKILALSYKNLPNWLKPCFLYMGMFPEDYTIPVSKLVHLWAAEGFLGSNTSASDSENLAREYLEDLVGRSLISVSSRCYQHKIKVCRIHNFLWKLCQQKAQKEKFLYAIRRYFDASEDVQSYLRLSICPNVLKNHPDIVHGERHRTSIAHSLLCIGTNLDYPKLYTDYSEWNTEPRGLHYTRLRVLDLLTIHLHYFPSEISNLASLRYLALSFTGQLPPSISQLQNLEMIVHKDPFSSGESFLPVEIWMMSNLRHLLVPASGLVPGEGAFYLQTLMGVINLSFGIGFLDKIRSLKKLAISYFDHRWQRYELQNLAHLNQLEKLKFQVIDVSPELVASYPQIAFPQSLKKLTLSGCKIPWKHLTIVGALPNLEVLKLRHDACQGDEWEPNENQFGELKVLELRDLDLVYWRGDNTHFPHLKRLVVKSCNRLLGIPSGIGDISALERIELVNCHLRIVNSAKMILEEQDYYGNSSLQVCVYNA